MQNVSDSKGGSVNSGLYIAIEGLDGGGKTKHAPHIVEYFESLGHDIVHVFEPGATEGADLVRNCIFGNFKPKEGWTPKAELALYLAARAQVVHKKVIPALQEGRTVITDRWGLATVCYQGFGRELDPEWLNTLNAYFTSEVVPDINIILRAEFDTMLDRAGEGSTPTNDREVYRRAWEAYEQLADADFAKKFDVKNVIMVDTEQPFEQAKQFLQEQLDELLATV